MQHKQMHQAQHRGPVTRDGCCQALDVFERVEQHALRQPQRGAAASVAAGQLHLRV